jgi:transaldolase
MKFFVDTADVKEIKELNDLGLLDGVTTNPSLILKSGGNIAEVTKEICDIVEGPVSAEVVATEYKQMMKEAEVLAKIAAECLHQGAADARRPEGLQGASAPRWPQGQRDAVLLGQPGAARGQGRRDLHLALHRPPRRHRHRRHGTDRRDPQIYDNYDFETEILAASVRTVNHVKQAALIGADVVTAPPATLRRWSSTR